MRGGTSALGLQVPVLSGTMMMEFTCTLCLSGITARAFCQNRKATLRSKGNKDSQNNTQFELCLFIFSSLVWRKFCFYL